VIPSRPMAVPNLMDKRRLLKVASMLASRLGKLRISDFP
jgi:hypothetical protein